MITRRQNHIKDDPFEELMEVYQDVKEIEQNLSKSLNIASKYPIIMIILYRFYDTKEKLGFPGTYRDVRGPGSY